jgi:uncharacterized small protein (DUF1192 family)
MWSRCICPSGWGFRLGVLGSLALSACAADNEAMEKRISKLQEEVTRLQADLDRGTERLSSLEERQSALSSGPGARPKEAEPKRVERPQLKVVRVEPGGEPAAAASEPAPADDAGPRLVIQGEGKELETRTLPAPSAVKAKSSDAPASKR